MYLINDLKLEKNYIDFTLIISMIYNRPAPILIFDTIESQSMFLVTNKTFQIFEESILTNCYQIFPLTDRVQERTRLKIRRATHEQTMTFARLSKPSPYGEFQLEAQFPKWLVSRTSVF